MSVSEEKVRDIAGETAQQLRRGGMDSARAEKVGLQIAQQAARKANGEDHPEHFRPIANSRPRR